MRDKYVISEYCVSGFEKPLTFALVADLHEFEAEEVLKLLQKSSPDLIFVVGDTFERHAKGKDPRRKEDYPMWAHLLGRFLIKLDHLFDCVAGERKADSEYAYHFLREASKLAPVYLSLGNHEWYLTKRDVQVLKEAGVTLLDNADTVVEVKGAVFSIGGLSSAVDLAWLENFSKKKGYKILLCHHPEYCQKYIQGKYSFNLICSGHAHGGQIRIGNQGLFAPGQGLFPKYTKGVYEIPGSKEGKMIVSAGCANTASIPRFGNPCEVVAIRLL